MNAFRKKNSLIVLIVALSLILLLCITAVLFSNTLTLEICLTGQQNIMLHQGASFTDPGAQAFVRSSWLPDWELKLPVETFIQLDTGALGDTSVRYEAEFLWLDCFAERAVSIVDNAPPVLTLIGDTQIQLKTGTAYTEPGYTATDSGIDLTDQVTIDGAVNWEVAGSYTLTYSVTDASGNTSTATRTVIVEGYWQPSNVDPDGKIIYLTFDDGPNKYTETLLDILAQYNVKVTFFVTNQSAKYAPVMRRIVEDGHAIGVHSYTHTYSDIYASKEQFFADFNKMRQLIYDHTGVWTTLHRFPGGSGASIFKKYYSGINAQLVKDLTDLGYQYFDWNVDSGDAGSNKTADAVFQAVISGVQRFDVSCVLQHDIKQHSVEAVARIIEWGLDNGYTFLALDSDSPVFHQTIR